MTPRFCSECGGPLNLGDRFCRRCGAPLVEPLLDGDDFPAPSPPHFGAAMTSTPGRISPMAALSFAWNAVKRDFLVIVGLFFVGMIASVVLQTVLQVGVGGASGVVLSLLVQFVIGPVVTLGLIRIALKVCDGQRPEFADLFSTWDRLLPYYGLVLLYIAIVFVFFIACGLAIGIAVAIGATVSTIAGVLIGMIGGVAVIAAGFYLWTRIGFAYYFLVDKQLGPVESLKASARATRGEVGNLLMLGLLLFVVALLGLLALVVGLFVAIPVIQIAVARAYRTLAPRTTPPIAEPAPW